MCLGVPGKIVEIDGAGDIRMGKVAFGAIVKSVCLEHVRDAIVGDYVLVHVGFALSRISPEEAARVFTLLAELDQLGEIEVPA